MERENRIEKRERIKRGISDSSFLISLFYKNIKFCGKKCQEVLFLILLFSYLFIFLSSAFLIS